MESEQRRQLWDTESIKYAAQSAITKETWPLPKSFLPRMGDHILDVGCGAGRFFPLFATLSPHLYGVDLSPKMVEVASKFAQCQVADVTQLPFMEQKFDFVFSFLVIGHCGQSQAALRELSRVCKRGKSVVLTVPHRLSSFALVRSVAMAFGNYTLGEAEHFTVPGMRKLGLECGLSLEESLAYSRPMESPSPARRAIGRIAWTMDKAGERLLPIPWGEVLCLRFEKLPAAEF